MKLTYYDIAVFLMSARSRFCSDQNFAAKLLNSSYKHPNGFTKIVFPDEYSEMEFRLHVWEPNKSDCDIHSHSSNLASFVICGGFKEEIWSQSEAGTKAYKFKYTPLHGGEKAAIEKVESCNISLVEIRKILQGEAFSSSINTIHRLENYCEGKSVTFVNKKQRRQNYSYLFSVNETNFEYNIDRLNSEQILFEIENSIESIKLISPKGLI